MTREELVEDVQVNDIVKIYTGGDEVFSGRIVSFGPSGLKLILIGTSTTKRIAYERIVEYDLYDCAETELVASGEENTVDVEETKVFDSAIGSNTLDVETESKTNEKPVVAAKKTIDRTSIFSAKETSLEWTDIAKIMIDGLNPSDRAEYYRVKDILYYAKKVKEYKVDSDRVKKAMAKYRKLAKDNKIFEAFIGFLYVDFGRYNDALDAFVNGGCYLGAFELTKRDNSKAAFENAILAVIANQITEELIEWLCEYSINNNEISVIKLIVSHKVKHYDKALVYWYAEDDFVDSLSDKSDIYNEQNIRVLESRLKENNSENEEISNLVNWYEGSISETSEQATVESPTEFKGIISYYNKSGGNGLIKEDTGGTIYFYIKQVKDLELQRILATQSYIERHVRYKKGYNFRDEIAADEIELDDDFNQDIIAEEESYSGVIKEYDIYTGFGRISSAGKLYNFVFRAIVDPLLRADIISEPYEIRTFDVKFNLKPHQATSSKKTKMVACNIVGIKLYSKDQIKKFIKDKLLTRTDADRWLGKDKESLIAFREAVYEPLKPLNSVDKGRIDPHLSVAKQFKKPDMTESQICKMLIPSDAKNPFLDLPKNINGPKTFQQAHRYMIGHKNINEEIIGIDLDRAEELFIKAIQANDQNSSAVANLANIYIKRGGDYIIKGLQLLEVYGDLLPSEKVTNLRVQLIDKSGNYDALEKILLAAIPKCVKNNTVWQYMAKIAGIYYKRQEWKEAAAKFKSSLVFLDMHKNDFPQYEKLRNGNWKSYIVSSYSAGDVELAVSEAKQFIIKFPTDLIIQSIINGTFNLNENITIIDDLEELELQYEDELIGNDNEVSNYLRKEIQKVNLSSTFNKVSDVYSKTQDGVFIGDSKDVKKALAFIQSTILKKARFGLNAEYRSAIYIGIAKIIYDSRNTNEKDQNRVDIEEVRNFGGRYARYLADAFVEQFRTIDSIRFLYIQALRYLGKQDDGNKIAAINMLVASFFISGQMLPNELHEMGRKTYNDKYYAGNCISIKDLCIATFMLQDKQEYVNRILQHAYDDLNLRHKMITFFKRNSRNNRQVTNYYDFEYLWKDVRHSYYANIEAIGREIKSAASDYNMVESIRQHVQKFTDYLDVKLLWNQDEKILKMYSDIIDSIGATNEKYSVEEKIEGYRSVESDIAKLRKEIEESPTELGYDFIDSALDELQYSIRTKFDELYMSSQPECLITLSGGSAYVNNNLVEIVISFKNAPDRQDADAVEIILEGSKGASFTKCEKKFTSIRSGEEQEYLAVFTLDDTVIRDQQFDVTVHLSYQFYDSVESTKTSSISEVLPVTITDKENFVPIENKYNRIFRGSGVDVKTPELFKGRDELIDSICTSMTSNSGIMTKNRGIILWGQRRVGKNSVKDYLKERIKKQYKDAYIIIELGSIGKCRNLKEILITIVNKTEDTLMTDYADVYEKLLESGMVFNGSALENTDNYMPEFSRFMDRLSSRLHKISADNQNIPLYFIDEFSYLYEWIEKGDIDGKEFMRFWKSFIQDYGICAIIIAQDNIPVWKAQYENEFACMNHDNEITYLAYEGAKELILEPCQLGDKQLFTSDAVKLIYDWTLGSAYLIVIFCKHIIDYLNDNYTERATKTIVQLVFEREFLEKKEMFKSEDFEPQIQDAANVGAEGERINKMNEQILKEIAAATITSSQAKISELPSFKTGDVNFTKKVFDRLKERKIIEVEKDTYCSIAMPLLKLYLLREQSILTRDILNKISR